VVYLKRHHPQHRLEKKCIQNDAMGEHPDAGNASNAHTQSHRATEPQPHTTALTNARTMCVVLSGRLSACTRVVVRMRWPRCMTAHSHKPLRGNGNNGFTNTQGNVLTFP
jgi:hypothetical protein